jgi:putative transposase
LGVTPAGFYAWCDRPISARAKSDKVLLEQIRQIHIESRGVYGSPRVHAALRKIGVRVGRKRVQRLMREAGLVGKVATLYRRSPGMEKFFLLHKNLKLNAPTPKAINQQWVADLTYIRVKEEWRYLAVVLDVFSRRVIGWSLGPNKSAELTLRALKNALKVREPKDGLIFHTDRGVEYGAHLIQNELKRHGIRSSMNRPGKCTDNAHMESFFHSLKAERIHGERFSSESELRMALNGYINQFYNQKRLHSGVGYNSPAEYEQIAA